MGLFYKLITFFTISLKEEQNVKEYLSSVEDVLKEQNSSPEGLTSAEAEKRLEKFGKNKLKEGKKVSLIKRFLDELADPMIIILIVAAVISGFTAYYEGESFADVLTEKKDYK